MQLVIDLVLCLENVFFNHVVSPVERRNHVGGIKAIKSCCSGVISSRNL